MPLISVIHPCVPHCAVILLSDEEFVADSHHCLQSEVLHTEDEVSAFESIIDDEEDTSSKTKISKATKDVIKDIAKRTRDRKSHPRVHFVKHAAYFIYRVA